MTSLWASAEEREREREQILASVHRRARDIAEARLLAARIDRIEGRIELEARMEVEGFWTTAEVAAVASAEKAAAEAVVVASAAAVQVQAS